MNPEELNYKKILTDIKKEYEDIKVSWEETIIFYGEDSFFKPLGLFVNHINWFLAITSGILILLITNINSFIINGLLFLKSEFILSITLIVISLVLLFVLKIYYFFYMDSLLTYMQNLKESLIQFEKMIRNYPDKISENVEENQKKFTEAVKFVSYTGKILVKNNNRLNKFVEFSNYRDFLFVPAVLFLVLSFVALLRYIFLFISKI